MPSSLPSETLFTIFANLEPGDLTPVIRASHRFGAIAEQTLYSNIVISEGVPRCDPVPRRTLRCCETLISRPQLAQVVRKFNIRWQTESGPREHYMPYVQPALVMLNRVLRILTQLEVLDLAVGLIGAPFDAEAILGGCNFPALRLFALCGVGRGSLLAKLHPYSTSIERFLSATPTIRHLRLSDHFEPINLAPSDLPALSAFRGTAIGAATIIPGRPVQCLALTGQEYISDEQLVQMARGTVRLRWLDLSAISVTPNVLRDISRRLPGVKQLRFKLALRHSLHHSFTGISILAGLSTVLGAFSELYQLDISSTPVSNMGLGSSLEESTLCGTWARSCPSLRQVTFPSKTEWNLSPEYTWVSHSTPRCTRA